MPNGGKNKIPMKPKVAKWHSSQDAVRMYPKQPLRACKYNKALKG